MAHFSQILPQCPGKLGWPWTADISPCSSVTSDEQIWPQITIVTPSYNQGEFLEKTIRSVLLQGYPNLEYIIIDGGSTDNSVEIIKKYAPWLTYWVSEKDHGQSHAINKGFFRSTGDMLGWLNSDDYFLPGALFKLAMAYNERSVEVGAICGQGRKVNTKGRLIYQTDLHHVDRESLYRWSYGNNFLQPSCLFTRSAWEISGPLDEDIHIALDIDLWLKISEKFKFEMLNECISVALGHQGAKTTALSHQMYVDLAFVYLKHGGDEFARQLLDDRAQKTSKMEARYTFLKKVTGVLFLEKVFRLFRRFFDDK